MEEMSPQERLAYDRTHLANERTFAAWLRTGLGTAALGFAAAHFVPQTGIESRRAIVIGSLFVLVGIAMIVFGARRYYQVGHDLAMAGSERARVRLRIIVLLSAVLILLLILMAVLL